MKQYLKLTLSAVVMIIIFCCLPFLVHALPPDPCSDPTAPGCDVPIDGGLSLLLAAGVGYGVKKIRDSRKKKQAEENI